MQGDQVVELERPADDRPAEDRERRPAETNKE